MKAPKFKLRQVSPAPHVSPVVEWRAGRIDDPVERLRYLRRAMGPEPKETFTRKKGLDFARRHSSWLLFMVVLIPAPTVSDATALIERPASFSGAHMEALEKFPYVWRVDAKDGVEVYSNGLRVETAAEVANEPRRYQALDRRKPDPAKTRWRNNPIGIVFHSTESNQEQFSEDHNRRLQLLGKYLLEYVHQKRAYNYLIDRFGRVFRVVREEDAAYHAGSSIWADYRHVYFSLNHSFLGVSFEAQTNPGETQNALSPAQVNSGRLLTEMLRAKHQIPRANCVTHAQVSVNPSNMQIGLHVDWATNFPFTEMGLPDNYVRTVPALTVFGFRYDPSFAAPGARVFKGLFASDEQVKQDASASGLTVARYRAALQEKFKRTFAAVRQVRAAEQKGSDEKGE